MTTLRTLLAACVVVCFAWPNLGRADRRQEIVSRGVLRVGTTGDYPPFSYRANAASPFVGLDIEMAGRLAAALGVRLELVPTSWPTLMKDFNAGGFDVAMSGVSITAERQTQAFFSLPYLRDGKTPITRCANQARFQTLAQIDRPGVRVVVNPGGTNERFARAHLRHVTLIVWPDNTTIFDRIVHGEADLMITDAIETRLQQRLRPELCAVHPEAPFDRSEKAYLLFQDAPWRAAVDDWLRPLVEGGEMTRRMEKWLDHPWPRAAPGAIRLEPLGELMAERLALMPDVARYKWNTRTPVEDPVRETQIIAALQREAEVLGVPAGWAERFFRAQIEAAKVVQRELFAQWTEAGQGALADAPDLAAVTRPRLDALTARMLRELAMAWPALSDPGQHGRITAVMHRLRAKDEPRAAAVALAIAPLLDGSAGRPGR
ncbi:MAG: gamma subclass chorismate mutase AroQ [Opitutaceae bacterium]|nr:gamma subclass chorismate mutase AroQ [Opitutaceae bacterium]